MKKIIITFFIFISSFSLAKNFDIIDTWYDTKDLPKIEKYLETGDIILYYPLKNNIRQAFGHILMVGKDKKIVDFPNFRLGFRESSYKNLSYDGRTFTVLRYKYMTDEIKEKIIDEIYNKQMYYSYFILTPTNSNFSSTYCSLFVYNVFKNAVGHSVVYSNSDIIFPVYFLYSGQNFVSLNFDNIEKEKDLWMKQK